MLACGAFTFSMFSNKLFTTEHTKAIFGLKCNALVYLSICLSNRTRLLPNGFIYFLEVWNQGRLI